MATFALGTAVGDVTALTLHLGYLVSGLLFAGVVALLGLAYWRFRIHPVLAFWSVYVLTRPLGASFADWLGKPSTAGGVGVGSGRVSLILLVVIAALVAYLATTRKDVQTG